MTYACDLCGKTVRRRRWVLLNRYVVSTGRSREMLEGSDGEGTCHWDKEGQKVTGVMLHYTPCLLDWLGAKMVELDWRAERPD